jgi:nucleoid-associated protein YgaU
MLSRYTSGFKIELDRNGQRYYATNIVNSVPRDIFEFTVVAQDGDRFDSLATRYYNDAAKWWIIAKANNLLNGTVFVQGGTQLIIPAVGLL